MKVCNLIVAASVVVALSFTSCDKAVTVVVDNALDEPRSEEIVELPVDSLRGLDKAPFVIRDSAGGEVPYQITYDGKVIFPASVDAGGQAIYTILPGTPSPVDTVVVGRRYPERLDDMTWENDKAAYRAYGPALQARGERAFGYDVFTKSVATPVVEERYRLDIEEHISYHEDHGNGMDVYSVGPTLGGGTSAFLRPDSTLVYPYCYSEGEVLDNGPLRFTVRLTYGPVAVGGDSLVVETRMISLDRGSHLNRTVITYQGLTAQAPLASGIVVHRQNPGGYCCNDELGFIAYADSTDNASAGNGLILLGLVVPNGYDKAGYIALPQPEGDALGHVVALTNYSPGDEYVYYWGSGWSKAGIADFEEWTANVMPGYARRLSSPLAVTVK